MPNLNEPLAVRMRPCTLADIVGQTHLLAKNGIIKRLVQSKKLPSLILFGPPGSGKTTLAYVLAKTCSYPFRQLNAVTAGVKDIKEIIEFAKSPLLCPEGQVLLFIDEIHRFNKSQQDALLPAVEAGIIILIGATTENPFFEVNKALLSRTTILELKALKKNDIVEVIKRALKNPLGLGKLNISLVEPELSKLAELANGDVRRALNLLELLASTTSANKEGVIDLNAAVFANLSLPVQYNYDKQGEEHYNNTSAFIKSMRGSDPDAAVFYLARALNAGEDPEFLARRIVIAASEEVGLANSQALELATAALTAVKHIGMPEARIILAHACIYVAVSPKSNAAYKAINAALADLNNKNCGEIPKHILNAPHPEMQSQLGYGEGYKYAHDYTNSLVAQQYLPNELVGTKYYQPNKNGQEAKIGEWLNNWRSYVGNELGKKK